ncbi:transposable element Tcb2 transposase [Trichonephila clavipes]|nr:transposable element Tcb2 transposase [Trichonephila clavipes]
MPSVELNLWKQFQDTGSVERKPGQRRSRATTGKEDRHLSIITRRVTRILQLLGSYGIDHREWSTDQWMTVLCTDESLFSLIIGSRRTFIWREPGTHYLPSNVQEIEHYGSRSLMVWSGISSDEPLHVFERGTVTAVCRDKVLKPYVCLFRSAVDTISF